MTSRLIYRGWLAALVGLMALGGAAWIYQFSEGLAVTGLSNVVSWGLYIIAFMFFVGLSAGGLIIVAGGHLAGARSLQPLSKLAVLLSAASIIMAAAFILPDMGRPERAFRVLISGQLYSPLVWDFIIISTYLIIACVDLWILTRPRESHNAMTVMALVSLPVAVLVHSITAWIFGLLVARPFWNSPLLAPLFVSSALVSGVALLLAVALLLRRMRVMQVERGTLDLLGKLMAMFVSIDLFFLFAEVLTAIATNEPDHREQTMLLLTGKLAWLFWPELIIGGLVPFVIFATPGLRRRHGLLGIAAVLAMAGVLLKRINIMMASMSLPLIELAPGQSFGRRTAPGEDFWLRLGDYAPTWVEWAVGAGIVALGMLIITLGVRYLVLRPAPPALGHSAPVPAAPHPTP